jgi:hypothetical protein
MKTSVNVYDFRNAFMDSDLYKDNFSFDGLKALYNYLVEIEKSTGEELDLDVIGFCCDFNEYTSADEAARECFTYEGMVYDEEGNETMTADEVEAKAVEFLENEGVLVARLENGGVIVHGV